MTVDTLLMIMVAGAPGMIGAGAMVAAWRNLDKKVDKLDARVEHLEGATSSLATTKELLTSINREITETMRPRIHAANNAVLVLEERTTALVERLERLERGQ